MTWTWDYFFVPQNQPTPAGADFGMFSPIHFGVLAILAVGIAVLVVTYTRAEDARRRTIRHVVGWTVLLLEVARQAATIASGHYTPEILPCTSARSPPPRSSSTPSGPTAGPATSSTPWLVGCPGRRPVPRLVRPADPQHLHLAELRHSRADLRYVLMRLVGRDLIPDVRNLPRVAIMMAVLAASGPGEHRVGHELLVPQRRRARLALEGIHTLAGPFYVPVLIVLLAIVWTLMYLPWELARRRASRRSATAGTA